MNAVRIHSATMGRSWYPLGGYIRRRTAHSCRYCQSYDRHHPLRVRFRQSCPRVRRDGRTARSWCAFRARHHPMAYDRPAERDDPRVSRPPGDAPARIEGGRRRTTIAMRDASRYGGNAVRFEVSGGGSDATAVIERCRWRGVPFTLAYVFATDGPLESGVERWQMLSSFRKRD